jgi:hypothetical protein
MHSIPVTVFDNFLDDPNKVRNWALQQEYFPASLGKWPGLRTKALHELNKPLFDLICRKFFSQFFDLENQKEIKWEVTMNFQNVDDKYHSGWIHSDEETSQITGILYLSPNSNLDGGTSIFREKSNVVQHVHEHTVKKQDSYTKKVSIEEVKKYKDVHNSQFEETIRISNVYNRLICFDSHLHHAAQNFFGSDINARLTLVFFVKKLFVNTTPVSRVRRITA